MPLTEFVPPNWQSPGFELPGQILLPPSATYCMTSPEIRRVRRVPAYFTESGSMLLKAREAGLAPRHAMHLGRPTWEVCAYLVKLT